MKQNKTKRRKIFIPIVMATLITTLGVGSLSYASKASAATSSTIAPYNTAGNKHGFGAGKGQGAAGTVTAIDGSSITIVSGVKKDKTFIVDASGANFLKTPTLVKGQKPGTPTSITLADIKVGDTVMIRGTINGTAIKATTVTDGVKMGFPENNMLEKKNTVEGTVSGVSGNSISLLDKSNATYAVDASNAKIMKTVQSTANTTGAQKYTAPVAITIADIKTGDVLTVNGTKNGTTIVATNIFDGKMVKNMAAKPNTGKMVKKIKPATKTKPTTTVIKN